MPQFENRTPLDNQRWEELFGRLGASGSCIALFEKVAGAYGERHRFYHTAQHIRQCLTEFDSIRKLLRRPDEVETAIWFHDVVYNPLSSKNEQKSADWASKELRNLNVKGDSIDSMVKLIMATRHCSQPEDSDTKFLVDIDLSILGSPSDIYHEYETRIRKEFWMIPGPIFRRLRKKILIQFISGESIYYTDFFKNRYELNARKNLADSISVLA